jgi:hypothetical protein
MRSFLFSLALLVAPLQAVGGGFEDGTIILLENSSNIVECYTDSTYSHIAIIMSDENGEQWLYNAEPPRVRRYRVVDYFAVIGRMNEGTNSKVVTSIVRPRRSYTSSEKVKMRAYLEDQVGRTYSIRGYLRDVPGTGIHCSELVAAAIESTGRRNFVSANHSLSPGELTSLISIDHVRQGKKLVVQTKKSERRTLCQRWSSWWKGRGTLCGWSCWETLRYCR